MEQGKRTWKQNLRDAIELRPSPPSHLLDMVIDIPKGATEGTILIPCAMNTVSHSIDVNPSLVKEDRCPECGGKIPLAEIKETRYRSCPLVTIRLNAPATQDLHVPITFGIYRAQILLNSYIGIGVMVFSPFLALSNPTWGGMGVALSAFVFGVFLFRATRKLRIWWKSVRARIRPVTS